MFIARPLASAALLFALPAQIFLDIAIRLSRGVQHSVNRLGNLSQIFIFFLHTQILLGKNSVKKLYNLHIKKSPLL